MNNELISREDLLSKIYDKYMSCDMKIHNDTVKEIIKIIQEMPILAKSIDEQELYRRIESITRHEQRLRDADMRGKEE